MADAGEGPVTDGERDRLVAALHRHVAEGRLDLPGFDGRAAQVYRAPDRAAARQALDGLPLLDAAKPDRRARHRHGEAADREPHWVATPEVFRDPSSARVMRVWVDPADGSRHYREVPPPAGGC